MDFYKGNAMHCYVGVWREMDGENVFYIVAETGNRYSAMFIRNAYNKAYKEAGMNFTAEAIDGYDLPKKSIFEEQ